MIYHHKIDTFPVHTLSNTHLLQSGDLDDTHLCMCVRVGLSIVGFARADEL